MCGIVVECFKRPVESCIEKMSDAIIHRGKDNFAIDRYDNFNVAYNRLAITDINVEPSFGSWKIYLNGEIYNYKELGFEGCEVEVLSRGFEKFGTDFVQKLNGMFFIVAVMGDNVYCFRDRYGIKPAYYFINYNVVLISSEIKAILQHSEYKFSINENAKRQWFVFNNCFTDETLFSGIKKLEKGTVWDVCTGETTKFWEWKFEPIPINYETAKSKVKELVIQAVKRQIPKETGYSCCLSGGVDSNIIATILQDVKTFTAGFAGTEDESEFAKLTGTDNETVIFDKVIYLRETIAHLEDLRVGASWSNYGLFKRISQEHERKVCFDGAGADELFGGYSWRYKSGNYYDVVNRTGIKDKHCEELFKEIFSVDTLENRFKFDADYFLEGVLLVGDKMSMAHTIELRVPFLDNDLVDFCLTLPNEYRAGKKILKDAFKNELPIEILFGKKKGFSSPDWFTGPGNQALRWATAAYNEWERIFNK